MKSPKNVLIAFLALTTVAGAAVAWQQYQELIRLRAAALASSAERADWQKRLWAAEKHRTELESQIAALPPKPPGPEDAADPEVPGREGPRGGRGNGRFNFMAMMDQPEMQKLVAIQQKAGLDSHYSALFKALNLTPDQLDKFKNLLVEKRTAMMDVMAAAREQGINPRTDPNAFRQLIANAQAEIDNSIKTTLGETAFNQYQNYEKTLPQRGVVDQLQGRLSYSGTPLSTAQSEQMVQILATTAPARATGNMPLPLTPFGNTAAAALGGGGARITDAAINQSLGVLAAPQVDALKQLQQEQQAQAELNAAIRNQFRDNRSPAPATGTTPATPASPTTPAGSGGRG